MSATEKTRQAGRRENEELRVRLAEAEETLAAIRRGAVDAVVVSGPEGEQLYTLREVDYTYRRLVEEIQEGALMLTPEGVILYSNRRFGEMLETPLARILGASVGDFIAPADRDELEAVLEQGSRETARVEIMLQRRDGLQLPVYLTVSGWQLGGAAVLCGMVTDLREQKRMEQIVVEERLARAILEQATEAVVVCDPEGTIIRASRVAQQLCDRNPLQQPFAAVFPLQMLSGERSAQEESGQAPFSVSAVLEGERFQGREAVLTGKADQRLILLLSATPLWGEERQILGCVLIMTDITQRKQMERELIRLERLRAVGELAAGVSHNLNNMLNSVLGPAQLLKRATDDPTIVREAEMIIIGAKRARDLVQQLNRAVRGEKDGALYPVSVNEVVQQVVHSTRPRWKDQSEAQGIAIEVVAELEDVPSISGRASDLYDILLNLLFNAVDAMPEGGTITFRTQAMEENVQLTVTDTGKGMDEEVHGKVFEPFFTTKMDVGSGLGLTTVYGTITRWGGRIDVESQPGEGTTFTVQFPVWSGPKIKAEEKTTQERQVHSGKLLIVEDDERTGHLLERLLSETYEVEIELNGREALEQFVPGQYDAALIDLGMPGKPGDQIAREMMRLDPAVVTVLITGWDLKPDDPRSTPFDFQVQKPFDDLDKVEDVIARAIELHDQRAGKES